MTTPRIYVACLAAYNSGHLHGQWIDVTDKDEIQEKINAMLSSSPIPNAEEWEIHDHEGLSTYGDMFGLDTAIERAEFIAEYPDFGEALIEHTCGDMKHAHSLAENYNGSFESEIAFAYHIIEECYDSSAWPKTFSMYFDYESFARDLFLDGYTAIYIDGEHHIFSDC